MTIRMPNLRSNQKFSICLVKGVQWSLKIASQPWAMQVNRYIVPQIINNNPLYFKHMALNHWASLLNCKIVNSNPL